MQTWKIASSQSLWCLTFIVMFAFFEEPPVNFISQKIDMGILGFLSGLKKKGNIYHVR